jgi:hypothetical protein
VALRARNSRHIATFHFRTSRGISKGNEGRMFVRKNA